MDLLPKRNARQKAHRRKAHRKAARGPRQSSGSKGGSEVRNAARASAKNHARSQADHDRRTAMSHQSSAATEAHRSRRPEGCSNPEGAMVPSRPTNGKPGLRGASRRQLLLLDYGLDGPKGGARAGRRAKPCPPPPRSGAVATEGGATGRSDDYETDDDFEDAD